MSDIKETMVGDQSKVTRSDAPEDWKVIPKLEDLKRDFEAAKQYHESHMIKVRTWRDNLNVENQAVIKPQKNRSSVQPKLIRKQAEWRYASLTEPFLNGEDIFDVNPRTWEDRKGAEKNKLMLNYQFNTHIDRTKLIDEYIRAAVDEGTAILKTGWEYETKEVEELQTTYTPVDPSMEEMEDYIDLLDYAVGLKADSPSEFLVKLPEDIRNAADHYLSTGEIKIFVPAESKLVKVQKTVVNRPIVEICEIDNVFFDPTIGSRFDRSSFVIHGFETSKSELQKDSRYFNLDKLSEDETTDRNIETVIAVAGDPNYNFKDQARKKVVAYEYWGYLDVTGDGTLRSVVITWVNDVIIRMEDNPFPDQRIPFIPVPYLPVRGSIYGEPDGALLEDNQKILGALSRGIIDLMAKNVNGQTGVMKGALDISNRIKYQNGEDYEFNPNHHPTQAFHTHQFPEIPNSAFQMMDLQNIDAESLTGVKAFSSGLSQTSLGNVATSVRGVLDAASKREAGILRRLASGMEAVGVRIIEMNKEFLEEEEQIRITNENFEPIYRDELAGSYDLKLSISTAEENAARSQELAFILQTLGNTIDPDGLKIMLGVYARLNKLPDVAKSIETYQPEPDPIEQEARMLENELLRAKVMEAQAKAQKAMSEAGLNTMKANSEVAKAENLTADTNMKTLDFVEQESGVKQERDLQRVGEQARSNIEYANVQHRNKQNQIILDNWLSRRARQQNP